MSEHGQVGIDVTSFFFVHHRLPIVDHFHILSAGHPDERPAVVG
jgi:hypothetical protein